MKLFMYFVIIPALLPVFLIFRYIYLKDKIEREPLGFVLKVVIYGAIFALPCAPVERFLIGQLNAYFGTGTVKSSWIEFTFGVALVEEFFKWLVIMFFVWKNPNFDYRYDGIVYAASSSLGFAGIENILYIMSYGTAVSISRAIFSIPGHAAFGIFMGYYLSRSKDFSLRRARIRSFIVMLFALAVPTAIHGVYDFLLSEPAQIAGYGSYFFIFVLILDFLSWRIIHHEFKTDRALGIKRRFFFK